MAMSALTVTPAKLKSKATEFSSDSSKVNTTCKKMFNLIKQLNGAVWSGTAADAYKNQFNKLEDDTQRMVKMINEFVSDLQDIATEYQKAETTNETTSKSLTTNVIEF